MTHLKCSECGGNLARDGKILKCTSCGRQKEYQQEDKSHISEVDMNDNTKDMDILLE